MAASRPMVGAPGVGPTAASSRRRTGPSSRSWGSGAGGASWAEAPPARTIATRARIARSIATDQGNGPPGGVQTRARGSTGGCRGHDGGGDHSDPPGPRESAAEETQGALSINLTIRFLGGRELILPGLPGQDHVGPEGSRAIQLEPLLHPRPELHREVPGCGLVVDQAHGAGRETVTLRRPHVDEGRGLEPRLEGYEGVPGLHQAHGRHELLEIGPRGGEIGAHQGQIQAQEQERGCDRQEACSPSRPLGQKAQTQQEGHGGEPRLQEAALPAEVVRHEHQGQEETEGEAPERALPRPRTRGRFPVTASRPGQTGPEGGDEEAEEADRPGLGVDGEELAMQQGRQAGLEPTNAAGRPAGDGRIEEAAPLQVGRGQQGGRDEGQRDGRETALLLPGAGGGEPQQARAREQVAAPGE